MIDRRTLLQGLLLSASTSAASTWSGATRAQGRPFTYAGYGGSTMEMERKYLLEPAAKKLALNMVFESSASAVKVQTMVQANQVGWDLVSVGPRFLLQGSKVGVLEKVDPAIVDQSGLPKIWQFDHGRIYIASTYVVAYNTEAFPGEEFPRTWADFWNVKRFPGPRSMYKELGWNYEAALRAAGVPRDEIYPVTDEKMKMVFAKLNEIKPHVKVWWVNAGQPGQVLATGEVAVAMAMTGRLNSLLGESVPVKWTYDDGFITNVALCIPKGSAYTEQSMQVLKYIMSEEAQTALLNSGLYGPALTSVMSKATPAQLANLSLSPQNLKTSFFADAVQADLYSTKYARDWLQFIAG